MLIAGKTGSGKSTFLHILITNASLHYGPDQLHFYLIDFKKGVEFKTYATHELPHARVIAIESDREFGVSVLERLDAILKERGDLFREVGVQDLAGFRDARPGVPMPRLLLIVDEFQEFFVEDDKHSQTAALLLDRLVRQGRAFGVHVLLGSQTLGGAYSLARSTLGQMAVRIALQCSESDAHLILSEDNTAARLLTRPGEAIYNDANGMLEGNHPFQIAWLEDDRRDFHLGRVQQLSQNRHVQMPPAIVFEGNIPADPHRNIELSRLIDAPQWEAPLRERVAWLGEAVAIKDPTAITFHPQAGQNLLVVGQSDLATVGLLATSLISLACQIPPNAVSGEPRVATFVVLDGNFGGVSTETWKELQAALPHEVTLGEPRDVPAVLTKLTTELTRREQSGSRDDLPIFVVIFNLGRFRDLKKSDDDMGFSFGSGEKKVSPGKQFTDLLKNGPGFGIHTLVWSDTYNNVSRWFSSQTLREFEMRIVFQLSASDSSNLIDSPLASKLGPNRAILHSVDQGSNEKFRPYGPPSPEWLSDVAARLHRPPPTRTLTNHWPSVKTYRNLRFCSPFGVRCVSIAWEFSHRRFTAVLTHHPPKSILCESFPSFGSPLQSLLSRVPNGRRSSSVTKLAAFIRPASFSTVTTTCRGRCGSAPEVRSTRRTSPQVCRDFTRTFRDFVSATSVRRFGQRTSLLRRPRKTAPSP